MWMVEPQIMCRKHLMGEHVELHMFLGHMKSKKGISGFIRNDLLEPLAVEHRHSQLAKEIINREYNHKSELEVPSSVITYLKEEELKHKVDVNVSLKELIRRCPECRRRYEEYNKEGNMYAQAIRGSRNKA